MRHPSLQALAFLASLAVLVALAVGCSGGGQSAEATPVAYYGTRIEPPVPMSTIQLVNAAGDTVSPTDFRGRVLAVFFGYTHCPDVCPLTLATLTTVTERLTPEERDQFAVLMVAVDPERDTPEVLRTYLDRFNPEFADASGTPEVVSAALADWGIQVERRPIEGGGYSVTHPASIYFLDREGRWVLASDFTAPVDEVTEDVRHLIANRSAPEAAEALPSAGMATSPGGPVQDATRWFFALGDGSVVMRDAEGLETQVLAPWSVRPSEDDLALRQYPGAREIAYDRATGMLWFADTHEAIHSVDIETGERGPSIDGFSDAALPGCGVADLSREFALLPGGQIIVPTLLGTTLVYDSTDGRMMGALDPTAFGPPLLGQFRPFIAVPGTDDGWFVDALGRMHEFDTNSWTVTGVEIGTLPDAPPSAFLEIALDPTTGHLFYLTTDQELRGWDMDAGKPVPVPFDPPPGTRALAAG